MSYGIVSILVISRCAAPPYPATPDFLRKRGQNKTPRNTLFINGSTVSKGYSATACGGKVVAPATKGGMHFPRPQGGCMVFTAKGGIKMAPKAPYLPSGTVLHTSRGRSPQPVREASADPGQNPWRPGPKARRRHQPSPAKAGVNLREYSFPPPMSKRSLSPSQQRWLSGSHLPAAYRSRPVPVRTWPLPER